MTAPAVVLGDGPAGCAAAVTLLARGGRVVLSGRDRSHPVGTLELLSGRASSALLELGWYDAVVARATPCDTIVSRWGTPSYDERSSVLEPHGLGWIVDRAWFDDLVRSLAADAGVVCRTTPPRGEPTVLATGKNAAGEWRVLGPDLLTVRVVVPSRVGLRGRLVVESAVRSGGWWSALDDGTTCAVSWTVPAASARGRADLLGAWRAAVRSGPRWLPPDLLGRYPTVRPSRSRVAEPARGALRVGDAALSVDPLSGHGLTLALLGAVRCLEPDYRSWVDERAAEHAAAARSAYRTGGYVPEPWVATSR